MNTTTLFQLELDVVTLRDINGNTVGAMKVTL